MNKTTGISLIIAIMAFMACGPSAEEKAKNEQHLKDSLHMDSVGKAQAKAMRMKADSATLSGPPSDKTNHPPPPPPSPNPSPIRH